MPNPVARWRRRLPWKPYAWAVLFLRGTSYEMRTVILPDGSKKKKLIRTQAWSGLRGLWENRHYRKWVLIWVTTVLVFALFVFGEPLLHRTDIAANILKMRPDSIAATQAP